jgi:hypothetical protein
MKPEFSLRGPIENQWSIGVPIDSTADFIAFLRRKMKFTVEIGDFPEQGAQRDTFLLTADCLTQAEVEELIASFGAEVV